jgi:hypothetical protein
MDSIMIEISQGLDTGTHQLHTFEESPVIADRSLPPDCDPEKYLDWRCRYGYYLALNTAKRPIQHADPWVSHAANLLAVALKDRNGCRPTEVAHAIKDAGGICSSDTLVRQVLEARLLAQQSPSEIAGKCNLNQLTIEAYAALFFDVRGQRRTQVWFRTNFFALRPNNSLAWQLGSLVKSSIFTQGFAGIEDRIGVLLGLGGTTLADELPDRWSPSFPKTFRIRQEFAGPLLPRGRKTAQLYERFQQAAAADIAAGRLSDEAVAAGIDILRRAKLPRALQKQLEQLRQHCKTGAEAAVTAETAGAA